MHSKINSFLFCAFFSCILIYSCSSHGPGLFGKRTPHEQYAKKIEDSGLKETAIGSAWLKAAILTLSRPLDIALPYNETGYFAAEKANGIGLRFHARRGEKLKISLTKKPAENFALYVDLWQPALSPEESPKLLLAADTVKLSLEYNVTEDTIFILRIQPELLKEGNYTLDITAGPSLAFPISPEMKSNIGSFFGAGRDKGERKHEGIDIFAPVHSPAIASANGTVTSVSENKLGGKVVFLRPDNESFVLYYAHLDSQIAVEGQRVKSGDVLGLTGNTGNARFTPSHLHFGIYTNKGAIDPLYFVKPAEKKPPRLTVSLNNLHEQMRSKKNARLYSALVLGSSNFFTLDVNTLLLPEAASGNFYRVILPDGNKGFVDGLYVTSATKPLKRFTIKKSQPLFSSPDSASFRKRMLSAGDKINMLASFRNFYFVNTPDNENGWMLKDKQTD